MKQITKFLTRIAIVSAMFLCNSHLMAQVIWLNDGVTMNFAITGSYANDFGSNTANNSATPIIQIGDESPVDITLTGDFSAYYGNFTFTDGSTLYFAPSNSNMPAKMVIGGTGFTVATTFVKQTGGLLIAGYNGSNNTFEIQPYGVLDLTDAANTADLELFQSLYISSYNDANAGLIKFKPGATTYKLICDNGTIKTDDPTNGQIDVSKHFQFDMSAATGTDGDYSDFIVATTLEQPYITNASSPNVINQGLWQNISVEVTGSGPYNIILHAQYNPYVVNIPDANFKTALLAISGLNTIDDGEISFAEASAYTGTIDVSYQNIIDLTGIEAFTKITGLNCSYNSLPSLNVSNNTALTSLTCNNNSLTSLNVSANTALTYLDCSYNSISTLDVSLNTALQTLNCNYNSLTSLDVSSNTALQTLNCNYNSLTSLDVATALNILYCSNNQLSSLNTSGVTALTELHCAKNQLASLDISTNTALTILGCSNNQLTSLVVSGNTDLSKLHCQNNQITSLDVSANTALTLLYCYYNSLTSLNVKNGNNSILTDFNATGNPDLTCIQVDNAAYSTDHWTYDGLESFSTDCACIVTIPDDNFKAALLTISGIDTNSDGDIQCFEATAYAGSIDVNGQIIADLTGIEAFTNITYLNCSGNLLTSLDVSSNTALQTLYCNNNLLTSLDVSGLTSLTEIYCYENQLPTLDVSSNTALQTLNCNYNSLTTLIVSGLTSLSEIYCSNNQLASLDFSSNTALYYLDCSYNSLTSLNVKNGNNTNFSSFNATNNPALTCIQIDGGSVDYSGLPWTNKDAGASYNEVCGWSTVNIPDLNFKAALVGNDAIDNNPADDEIQYDEATAYTGEIIVNGLSIANLTGIEAFTKITNLDCSYNSLMTLNVSANTALTALYCNNNHLTSLNVKNTNNSNFTNFNASNNPDLTCIQIDGGGVVYSDSPWTNKDDGASYNEVCTVNIPDAIFKMALVGDPSINTNTDTEIQYDEASAYAGSINVNGQSISDLTGIEAFTNITYLDCSSNSLTSLDVSANTALEYLYCSYNLLEGLDVSSNTALETLYCTDNSLTTLIVSGITSLTYIDCSYNQLASLDVSANTALTYLGCRYNQLSSLNTSGVAALTELHCANNQLASLGISTNTDLTILGCSNNRLTSLVVFANTALSLLHCQNNQLVSLDVSSNTALENLYCYDNLLRSLNVQNGNNDIISDFDATSNPSLSCIQVDAVDDGSTDSWNIDTWASFNNTSCEAPFVWNGSTNSDWDTATNWDLISVPTVSNDVIIPDVTTNDPVISSPGASCSNLSIESGGELTLTATGSLTVGNTCNYSGTLTIKSDATGTGSLITTTASGDGTGIAFAECYMTTGAWHQVSPPLAGQTVAAFLTANANVATKDGTSRAMMNYNPSENTWSAFYTNESASGTFEAGQGYMMRTDYNSAVIFAGVITTGSPTVYLSGAGDIGWNLIGNPYTSAINTNTGDASFLKTNESLLDPSSVAIYVWNQDAGVYNVINYSSGADIAALGQAYFVKSNFDGNYVTFNSDMQVHSSATLKSAKTTYPEIKLIAANNGTKAATSIKFISGTTKGLDPGYDAGLFSLGSTVSLYTKLIQDNGVNFMLQCLPDNDFSSLVIPVGIDSKTGGEVVFSAELLNLPSDCKPVLEDKLAKTFTDLSKNNYTVTIATNSSISDRFQIHTSNLTTGLDIGENIAGQLSAYAVRNVEIRVKGNVGKQAVATLYDIQGRVILVKNLEEGSLNVIGTPNLGNGIYLLSVKDNNRVQGFKIPVSE